MVLESFSPPPPPPPHTQTKKQNTLSAG